MTRLSGMTAFAVLLGSLSTQACAPVPEDLELELQDQELDLSSTVGPGGIILFRPKAQLMFFSEAGFWGDSQTAVLDPASGTGQLHVSMNSTLAQRASSVRLVCGNSAAAAVLTDAAGHKLEMTCLANEQTDVNLHSANAYPGGVKIADAVTSAELVVHPNAVGILPLGQIVSTRWQEQLPAAIEDAEPGGIKGALTTTSGHKEVELIWLSYDRFKLVQEFDVNVFGTQYLGGFELLVDVRNEADGPHFRARRTDAWVNGWCDRNVIEVLCNDLLQDKPWAFGDDVYRAMRSGGDSGARRVQEGLADFEMLGAKEGYIEPDVMSVYYSYVPN